MQHPKKKSIILFTLFLFSYFAHAQMAVLTDGTTGKVLTESRYSSVDGSPFLIEDWRTGEITGSNGKNYENVYLRYNAYEDQLEMLQEQKPIVLYNDNIKEFQIFAVKGNVVGTRTFRNGLSSLDEFTGSNNGFYEVYYDGDIKLVAKHYINLVKVAQSGYNVVEDKTQFVKKEDFYVVKANGEIEKIKLKKKDIINLLSSKKKEVANYIKNNDLSYKDEADVAKVLEFYDSL